MPARLLHALLKPFLDICLLRLAPQELPASGLLLAVALLAHTITGILISIVQLNAANAVAAGITDTLLLCALTFVLLSAHRLGARLTQTLTALAGSGAIIGLIALPVTGWFYQAHAGTGSGGLPALILLVLIAWSITVVGHVLRHALSAPFFLGMIAATAFYGISIWVLNTLFPTG